MVWGFKHTSYDFEREYPKLVRDRIPEILQKKGEKRKFDILKNDKEFLVHLFKKLTEESIELQKSVEHNNWEEELADIFEVLETILRVKKRSRKEIAVIQKKKRNLRGGFRKRFLMLKKEV